MAKQKVRIRLRAFDHRTLDIWAGKIVEIIQQAGARVSGPVPLPTEKSIFTVLRSPHVDKKSREQFEIRVHKRLIEISNPTPEVTKALMNLDLPQGVDIEIKL